MTWILQPLAGCDTMIAMESYIALATWPVIGHDWAVDLLRHVVAAGRPPHALLITGPPNVGKGTLARSLAQALLCTDVQRPCGMCRACHLVTTGNHPDLRWVEPQAGSLKIAQIRDLTRQLNLSPLEGPWQIAILDRFELATPGAANALLKTLEEPPPSVILVLLAQQAEALLPTIVSRCQIIALRPIPRAIIERVLVERWQVPPEKAHLLSHICGGRLGWAISAAGSPELLEHRTQRLDDLVKLLHSRRVDRFAYAESLARENTESVLDTLELWMGWWRDLLLLASRSPVPLMNIDRQRELDRMVELCDLNVTHSALAALQTTVDQMAHNANTRLTLEVLLLDLPFLA
jgi:DNA polymerase-3 subunit delta'